MSGTQGTAYGANATLMQGLEKRWIARAGAENCIQKEVVIAPLYVKYVVTLRRSWPHGSVFQTGLPLGQGDRGSEDPRLLRERPADGAENLYGLGKPIGADYGDLKPIEVFRIRT